jgi:hypothetical protein
MEEFFSRVEDIKSDMGEIKGRQRDIGAMHERSKTIVRQKEMQRHREEMQVGRAPRLGDACAAWGSGEPQVPRGAWGISAPHFWGWGWPERCRILLQASPHWSATRDPRANALHHPSIAPQAVINEVNTIAHRVKAKVRLARVCGGSRC